MYLDDTGHMSGVDPLLALDRAARRGLLTSGDLVLLLAAGTGYTWAGLHQVGIVQTLGRSVGLDYRVTSTRARPKKSKPRSPPTLRISRWDRI